MPTPSDDTIARLRALDAACEAFSAAWRNRYDSPTVARDARAAIVATLRAGGFELSSEAERQTPGCVVWDLASPEFGFAHVTIDHAGGEPDAPATLWAWIAEPDATIARLRARLSSARAADTRRANAAARESEARAREAVASAAAFEAQAARTRALLESPANVALRAARAAEAARVAAAQNAPAPAGPDESARRFHAIEFD